MENKNMTVDGDRNFIGKVVRSSLYILAAAFILSQIIWLMKDSIVYWAAKGCVNAGNCTRAMELVEGISDDEERKDRIYDIAGYMFDKKYYSEAAEIFDGLGDYKDSQDRHLQCSYEIASELYSSGDLEGAVEAFILLGDYSDSLDRQRSVTYEIAEKLFNSGDYSNAVVKFISLGNYSDSADKAFESAMAITGDENAAMAIVNSGGLPQEELEMALRIAERRSVIGGSAVAAGARHTVLRHADGTVSSCGDNSHGQCDVSAWSRIVEIRAGAYHTVGLREDGTVVAAGDNSNGQCNVSEWSNVVAIEAGDADTIGLTADGRVLSTGYHDYSDIKRAADVRAIFAGSYGLAVQTGSGSVVSSHRTCAFSSERMIVDAAIHTGYYAAAQAGGSVISSLEKAAEWKNIACIDGGPRGIIAADVDGKVRSLFFRKSDEIDFSSLADVCQCAAGTEHYVFLTADGMVYAFGDNTYGQCDVESLGIY